MAWFLMSPSSAGVRNYVQIAKGNQMPYAIFVEHATNLNRPIARAHEETEGGLTAAGKGAGKNKSISPGSGCAATSMMCGLLVLS